MTKTICDGCKKEILDNSRPLNPNNPDITPEFNGMSFKLRSRLFRVVEEKGGEGDFCKYCVLDAIAKLDDRVAEAIPPIGKSAIDAADDSAPIRLDAAQSDQPSE